MQCRKEDKQVSKYNSRKTVVNGITFDSKKEACRYQELLLLEQAGAIRDLKLQPEFTIQEAFITLQGERVRAIKYRADFSYCRRVKEGADTRWERVVEDVKGVRTKEYQIKKKLLLGKGIRVVEV